MIEAKVICDSRGHRHSRRITTLQLRYPRFVHSEFMTHRVFSRNASSSRAIPVAKLIEQVRTAPAMPIHWGKNEPGMQANAELDGDFLLQAKWGWAQAAGHAAQMAEYLNKCGAHKQIANRILEPFTFISVIVTATDWSNFFELRCHPDAQPEIRRLAEAMREALHRSIPNLLLPGQWHMPYVEQRPDDRGYLAFAHDGKWIDLPTALKVSTARCARVSYLTHEGKTPDLEKDVELYDRLVGSRPLHASPAEHQAMCNLIDETERWHLEGLSGNFNSGWVQHRQLIDRGLDPGVVTLGVENYQP